MSEIQIQYSEEEEKKNKIKGFIVSSKEWQENIEKKYNQFGELLDYFINFKDGILFSKLLEKIFVKSSEFSKSQSNNWREAFLQSKNTNLGSCFWSFLKNDIFQYEFDHSIVKFVLEGLFYYGFPQSIRNSLDNIAHHNMIEENYDLFDDRISKFEASKKKRGFKDQIILLDLKFKVPYKMPALKKLFSKVFNLHESMIKIEAKKILQFSPINEEQYKNLLSKYKLESIENIKLQLGQVETAIDEFLDNLSYFIPDIPDQTFFKQILQLETNPFQNRCESKVEEYFLLMIFLKNAYFQYYQIVTFFNMIHLHLNIVKNVFEFEEGDILYVWGKMRSIIKKTNKNNEIPALKKNFYSMISFITDYLNINIANNIKQSLYWNLAQVFLNILPRIQKKPQLNELDNLIKELMENNLNKKITYEIISEKFVSFIAGVSELKTSTIQEIYINILKHAKLDSKNLRIANKLSPDFISNVEKNIIDNVKKISNAAQNDDDNSFNFFLIFLVILQNHEKNLFELNFHDDDVLQHLETIINGNTKFSTNVRYIIEASVEKIIRSVEINYKPEQFFTEYSFEKYFKIYIENYMEEGNVLINNSLCHSLTKIIIFTSIRALLNIMSNSEYCLKLSREKNFDVGMKLLPDPNLSDKHKKLNKYCTMYILRKIVRTVKFSQLPTYIKDQYKELKNQMSSPPYEIKVCNNEIFNEVTEGFDKVILDNRPNCLTDFVTEISENTDKIFYLLINMLNSFAQHKSAEKQQNFIIKDNVNIHKSLIQLANGFSNSLKDYDIFEINENPPLSIINKVTTCILTFLSVQCSKNGLGTIFTHGNIYKNKSEIDQSYIVGCLSSKSVSMLDVLYFPEIEWRNYNDDNWIHGHVALYIKCKNMITKKEECSTPFPMFGCNNPDRKPYEKCPGCNAEIDTSYVKINHVDSPKAEIPKLFEKNYKNMRGFTLPNISESNFKILSKFQNFFYKLLHFIYLNLTFFGFSVLGAEFASEDAICVNEKLSKKNLWQRISKYYDEIKYDLGNLENFDLLMWKFLLDFYIFNNKFLYDPSTQSIKEKYEKEFEKVFKNYFDDPSAQIEQLAQDFELKNSKILKIIKEEREEKDSEFCREMNKKFEINSLVQSSAIKAHLNENNEKSMFKFIHHETNAFDFPQTWDILNFYQFVTSNKFNYQISRSDAFKYYVQDFCKKNKEFGEKYKKFCQIANTIFKDKEIPLAGKGCEKQVPAINYFNDKLLVGEVLPHPYIQHIDKKEAGLRSLAVVNNVICLHNGLIEKYAADYEFEAKEILHNDYNIPIPIHNITEHDIFDSVQSCEKKCLDLLQIYSMEKKKNQITLTEKLNIIEFDKEFRKKFFRNKRKFACYEKDKTLFPLFDYKENTFGDKMKMFEKFQDKQTKPISNHQLQVIRKNFQEKNEGQLLDLYACLYETCGWMTNVSRLSDNKLGDLINWIQEIKNTKNFLTTLYPSMSELSCSQILTVIYEIECQLCIIDINNKTNFAKRFLEVIQNEADVMELFNKNPQIKKISRYLTAIVLKRYLMTNNNLDNSILKTSFIETLCGLCEEKFFNVFEESELQKIEYQNSSIKPNELIKINFKNRAMNAVLDFLEKLHLIQNDQSLTFFGLLN